MREVTCEAGQPTPQRKCVHADSISQLTTTCQNEYKMAGLSERIRTANVSALTNR